MKENGMRVVSFWLSDNEHALIRRAMGHGMGRIGTHARKLLWDWALLTLDKENRK